MIFYESSFTQYLDSIDRINIHKKNIELYQLFRNKPYHIIIHGPSGIGKYSQSLKFISMFSNSNLKYQKKFTYTNEKSKYIFKLSDAHIEIDFLTLGCNSKNIWNEVFSNILNITHSNQYSIFFIICKNFQFIHNELHESFYSYMQTFMVNHVKLYFIINTNNISGININIRNASYILSLSKPPESTIKKLSSHNSLTTTLKALKINTHIQNTNIHKCLFKMIISDYIDINHFRKILYDILIYNIDIDECIWYVIRHFYKHHKITDLSNELCENIYIFYSQFNNNYRPIYHLELFFLNFIIQHRYLLSPPPPSTGTLHH